MFPTRPTPTPRWSRPLAVAACAGALGLALAACGSAEDPEEPESVVPSSSTTPAEPLSPTETGPATVDPTEPADEGEAVDPTEYDDVVTAAVDDLAQREGTSPEEVRVLSDAAVQWRDGSLGCPQAGQFYTQAITPGRRIILEVAGEQYAYHAAETGPAAYCENPEEPATE